MHSFLHFTQSISFTLFHVLGVVDKSVYKNEMESPICDLLQVFSAQGDIFLFWPQGKINKKSIFLRDRNMFLNEVSVYFVLTLTLQGR